MPEPFVNIRVTADDRAAPVCDFCGEPGPAWIYPARAFEVVVAVFDENDLNMDDSIRHAFDGEWSACPTCAELLERDDRSGLLRHAASFQTFEPGEAMQHARALGLLAEIHRQFLLHRNGPRRPYDVASAS
jgi:hypothetical protein